MIYVFIVFCFIDFHARISRKNLHKTVIAKIQFFREIRHIWGYNVFDFQFKITVKTLGSMFTDFL